MSAPRQNPFTTGIFTAVLGWLFIISVIAVINWIGIQNDISDTVVSGTMLGLAGWGHLFAVFSSYRLGLEIGATRRDLDRLFRLPAGTEIPESFGIIKSPLLLHLKYIRSLGNRGPRSAREALAEMTKGSWQKTVGKIEALATALVALGVVFTMVGFTIMGQKMGVAFAQENIDPVAAVVALIPAMATATLSSLLGGFLGGVSLLWIAARLNVEIEAYTKSIRAILEFAELGDDADFINSEEPSYV